MSNMGCASPNADTPVTSVRRVPPPKSGLGDRLGPRTVSTDSGDGGEPDGTMPTAGSPAAGRTVKRSAPDANTHVDPSVLLPAATESAIVDVSVVDRWNGADASADEASTIHG